MTIIPAINQVPATHIHQVPLQVIPALALHPVEVQAAVHLLEVPVPEEVQAEEHIPMQRTI